MSDVDAHDLRPGVDGPAGAGGADGPVDAGGTDGAADGAGATGAAPVRRLGPDDVPRVAELEREVFGRSAWTEAMVAAEVDGPDRWYVGLDEVGPHGTLLVGYGGLWFDGEAATVMTLAVAEGARGRGLGSMLLRALVDRARGLGATAVFLEVRVDNEPAIALYERFGFTTVGRRRRYYQPEDVDAFTMRLVLTGPDGDLGFPRA